VDKLQNLVSTDIDIHIIEEKKPSCTNPNTFIFLHSYTKAFLKFYFVHVRPLLVRRGDREGKIQDIQVHPDDLEHTSRILLWEPIKFQRAIMEDDDNYSENLRLKNETKWVLIVERLGPTSGWKTEGLTGDVMQSAYNNSKFNTALFLDHNGNRLTRLG
jgi:hypothetical protein